MISLEQSVEQYRRFEFYSGFSLAQGTADQSTFNYAVEQFLKYRIKRKKLEKYCLLLCGQVPESEEWNQRREVLDQLSRRLTNRTVDFNLFQADVSESLILA